MLQRWVKVIQPKLYTFYTPFTATQELDICGQVHIPAALPRGGGGSLPCTVSVLSGGWVGLRLTKIESRLLVPRSRNSGLDMFLFMYIHQIISRY